MGQLSIAPGVLAKAARIPPPPCCQELLRQRATHATLRRTPGRGARRARPSCRPAGPSTRAAGALPPSSVAYPASGTVQPPSSSARNARSATTACRVGPCSSFASSESSGASSLRALDREHALPDGREAHLRLEHLRHPALQPQPLQPRERQDRPGQLLLLSLPQARLHVAAQRDDLQVRPALEQLAGAAQRGGPHPGALGQRVQPQDRRADEGVPRVLPRRGPPPGRAPPAAPRSCPSGCARRDPRGRRAAPLRSPSRTGPCLRSRESGAWRKRSPSVVSSTSETSRPARHPRSSAETWCACHSASGLLRVAISQRPQPFTLLTGGDRCRRLVV